MPTIVVLVLLSCNPATGMCHPASPPLMQFATQNECGPVADDLANKLTDATGEDQFFGCREQLARGRFF